jgi:hypothetical protein
MLFRPASAWKFTSDLHQPVTSAAELTHDLFQLRGHSSLVITVSVIGAVIALMQAVKRLWNVCRLHGVNIRSCAALFLIFKHHFDFCNGRIRTSGNQKGHRTAMMYHCDWGRELSWTMLNHYPNTRLGEWETPTNSLCRDNMSPCRDSNHVSPATGINSACHRIVTPGERDNDGT